MLAGAGALISRTALERNTFEAAQGYIRSMPVQSGDAMLSKTMWFMFALAPTDPGGVFTHTRCPYGSASACPTPKQTRSGWTQHRAWPSACIEGCSCRQQAAWHCAVQGSLGPTSIHEPSPAEQRCADDVVHARQYKSMRGSSSQLTKSCTLVQGTASAGSTYRCSTPASPATVLVAKRTPAQLTEEPTPWASLSRSAGVAGQAHMALGLVLLPRCHVRAWSAVQISVACCGCLGAELSTGSRWWACHPSPSALGMSHSMPCRLEKALAGSGCDWNCHDQLQHTISVHVRGRHVAAEWWGPSPACPAACKPTLQPLVPEGLLALHPALPHRGSHGTWWAGTHRLECPRRLQPCLCEGGLTHPRSLSRQPTGTRSSRLPSTS